MGNRNIIVQNMHCLKHRRNLIEKQDFSGIETIFNTKIEEKSNSRLLLDDQSNFPDNEKGLVFKSASIVDTDLQVEKRILLLNQTERQGLTFSTSLRIYKNASDAKSDDEKIESWLYRLEAK